MRLRVFLLLVVAAMAGAAGHAIAIRLGSGPSPSGLDRLRDVSHLARALDLRPDQVEAVKSLQGGLCGQLAGCCARYCGCRKELAAALVAEPFDAARARELGDLLSRSYANSEMLAVEHIRSVRDMLDVAQRARFDRMIADALAGPCGACANCGAARDKPQGAGK